MNVEWINSGETSATKVGPFGLLVMGGFIRTVSHIDFTDFQVETDPEAPLEQRQQEALVVLVNQLETWLAQAKEAAGIEPDGAALIAAERQRHQAEEGWTADHDDNHREGELVGAAVSYAAWSYPDIRQYVVGGAQGRPPLVWPWELRWWKPKDQLSNLVRAGSLIAAEIDRLLRRKRRLAQIEADFREEAAQAVAAKDPSAVLAAKRRKNLRIEEELGDA